MMESSNSERLPGLDPESSNPVVYVGAWVVFWAAMHVVVFFFAGGDLWVALLGGAGAGPILSLLSLSLHR
ncbi:hypothetical protein C447_12410 [Halococcus hamelinensis 100A6]|uniref:Uncharacterized protein n=1 Tax=Halococcus hamelinensis 100A6 TaxID=1132509 RepID=M0LWC9_9EURY|nr:hypothetical protein C447_12410 [Halococcus hamelinensis 100A6]